MCYRRRVGVADQTGDMSIKCLRRRTLVQAQSEGLDLTMAHCQAGVLVHCVQRANPGGVIKRAQVRKRAHSRRMGGRCPTSVATPSMYLRSPRNVLSHQDLAIQRGLTKR